jgi:hypothetical protein
VHLCPLLSIQSISATKTTANANVSVIVRPVNEALANKHYILQDQRLDAADTIILNLNITMNSDVILAANIATRTGEATANCSVNAYGVEIS